MIASLPMYDLPEIRSVTDAWWRGLARHLDVTMDLDRGLDHLAAWRDPGLLFSQSCGYPLTHEFRGRLKLVATPHYAADGCEGPTYCSIVFARAVMEPQALRGGIAAFNNQDSMSGMLALKLVFAPYATHGRFFGRAMETGDHLTSMLAVARGKADVCAIDAVTAALARRYRPELLSGLAEIARSPQVPALPFVTANGHTEKDVERLRGGLARAFADPALAQAREALLLGGFSILNENDYERIVELEREMEAKGGLKLQ